MTDRQTGYPSVDQPWMKYYTKPAPELPSADMSMYDFLRANNKDSMDFTALNYYGRKISYRQLFENIERVATSLLAIGIKQGDIVTLCALNTPEFVYLLYALNKIGAISNWVGLTSPEQDLRDQISKTDTRIVFTIDVAYSIIAQASKGTAVEKIINVPIDTSMPALVRTIAKLKNKKTDIKSKENWKLFLKSSTTSITSTNTKGQDIAIIEYTGGSTGVPKGVMLSNGAMNSYYNNFSILNSCDITSYEEGDRFLFGVPLFLAFGASACCHGPLCHSMVLITTPDPSPQAGIRIVLEQKVNHIVAGRLLIEGLAEAVQKQRVDLSFVKSIVYGGEETNKNWEKTIIERLAKKSFNASLLNGYGMTETAAAILVAPNNVAEGLIPSGNVSVKVINPEDESQEYHYNIEGELCLSSDQLMSGYFKNEEETSEAFFEEDGVRWLKTHDLATISSDGTIKITGRIKRIYSKINSDRIQIRVYPMRIEETILSDNNVKACAVVGIKDDITAYRTIAYVIRADKTENVNAVRIRINNLCREKLPESHIPDDYHFIDSMPFTRAGKVDYRELERRAAEEVADV